MTSLLVLALATPLPAAQKQDSTPQVADSTVVTVREVRVEVSRLAVGGIDAARIPSFVSFQSHDQIRAASVLTVGDALGRLPGVHLNDQLGAAYQPDITLRGFTVSPVVGLPQSLSVFVDGVRVNEPDAAQVHFDLLPLDDIERIEVIRGPAGPFGRNTLAGALNIVTRRGGSQRRTEVEVAGGSFGKLEARAQTMGMLGPLDYYGSARYLRSDGWRDVTGARVAQFYSKLGHRGEKSDAWVSYIFASDSIEQAGSLPASWLAGSVPAEFASVEDLRKINFTGGDFFAPLLHFVTASYAHQATPTLAVQTTAFFRRNEVEQFNANITEANTRGISELWSLGLIGQLSYRPRPGLMLTGGLEYARDDVDARIFAEPNEASPDSGLTTHVETRQDEFGAFAQAWWSPGRRLSFLGSLRYDVVRIPFRDLLDPANDGTNTFGQFTLSAGTDYRLSDDASVYASYGRGFRAPVILELACADPDDPCPLPFELGADPPLDPVTTDTWQAGARIASADRFSLEVSAYWSEVHDDIFNVASPTTIRGFFRNIERTRRQGLEFQGELRAHERLVVRGDLSYTLATFRTRATLFAPFLDNDGPPSGAGAGLAPPTVEPGDRFPLIPDVRANIGVSYSDGRWRFSLEGSYAGSQWLRGDEDNTEEADKLDPYFLIDAYIERDLGPAAVHARIENVFDSSYETFGVLASNPKGPGGERVEPFFTPGFPRRIFAGVTWHW